MLRNALLYFRILLALFILFKATSSIAQQTPPSPYGNDTKINYARSWDVVKPETNPNNISTSSTLQQSRMNTQYIDGLGRPLQSVMKQGSYETNGSAADLVSAIVYDEFGREQYKYLPFVANNTGGNSSISDGMFKLNPFQQQATFMNSQYGAQGDSYFYSQTNFEASPLNRALESFAPGNSWVGTSGESSESNRRSVKLKYWINRVTDSVRVWNVTDVANNCGSYATGSMYEAGALYKNVTVDEHNNQLIEFKDKDGKVILKKVQLTAVADTGLGKGHYGWLCTYYVYDDLNNLRCVIQPEGVKTLAANSWSVTTTILNEQCFRYEYDERNRMVIKKVPGAGEVWMVYDVRDRLVLSQDSNMRAAGKWMYTLYDNDLNLPVSTGLWTNSSNRVYHQSQAYASTAYPNLSGQTYEELTVTFYGSYSWLGSYSNPLPSSYTNSYDTYFQTASNSSWPYPQANSQSAHIKGMATGTRIKILGTSTYLYTVSFYDEKARVIQMQSTNISGGIDIVTTQYTWAGQPLVMVQKQQKSGTGSQTTIIVTQLTYDDLSRLVKTEKKQSNTLVNSNAMSSYKTISQLEYDKLGQLKTKKLAPAYNSNAGIETFVFDYNIRGWMLGTNRSYLATTGQSGTTKFAFELGYDKQTNNASRNYTASQYNGNITGMIWKSDGDDVMRKYDFSYDAANRLMQGIFEQEDGIGSWNSTTMNYKVKMGNGADATTAYDNNGNIKAMTQYGWKLGGSPTTPIDDLTYNYIDGSNKLLNVIDVNNDAQTKLGDFRTSTLHPVQSKTSTTTDYAYDANGNLVKDLNKDIVTYGGANGIEYNYLNLPSTITVKKDASNNKGTIEYTYDAAGNKLKKVTTEGSTITTTLYIGGAVYQNDTLQFIGHEEGRMRPGASAFNYDYMIKDHLGNVRMVLTEEQKTDMYPAATMETAQATTEESLYSNISSTRIDAPTGSGYPSNTPSGNTKVAKVSGATSGNKIGPAILLKVMAGDQFHLTVNSWWNGSSPGTPQSPLNDLISALSSNMAGASGGKVTAIELTNSGLSNAAANSFLGSQSSYNTIKPKAFVNWICLDEQFKYYSSSSGFEQVGSSNSYTTHTKANLPINKNGYLYIYVSNETPDIDVFFDNLQVTHIRGPLLEETHYYPFGLTMTGISSKALGFGNPENKYKFNRSTELNSGLDISLYETDCRLYDPQIGRFWQVDELAESNWEWAPYNFGLNNPISFNDPSGLKEDDPAENGGKVKELKNVTVFSIPKNFWAQQRLYYQIMDILSKGGATIDYISQDNLRAMMYRLDGITQLRSKVAEMTRESDKVALEVGSSFIPVGWITKLRYVRYAANLFRFKRGVYSYRLWLALSKVEKGIVKEAGAILNSPQMASLKAAFEKGISAEVKVGGRTVIYNPEMAASGFTLHGEGFLLGREAFTSSQELGKTVLHELYRLGTQGTGELAVDVTKPYTNAAFDFAEKALGLFKF